MKAYSGNHFGKSTTTNRHARLFELFRQQNLAKSSNNLISRSAPQAQTIPYKFLEAAQSSLQARPKLGRWTDLFARAQLAAKPGCHDKFFRAVGTR